MQLYGQISKVEPQDDGTIKVFGIASAPVRDAHGEIVTSDAMKGAIEGYMKFPAVREMHDATKAAGRALEIGIDDDGKTAFAAHVVDPLAVTKVQAGVYSGFSIGGRVKKRNSKDRTIIEQIDLIEVSLVDRPSCPDAVINLWKADDVNSQPEPPQVDDEAEDGIDIEKRKWTAAERQQAAKDGDALPDGSYPIKTKEDLHDAIQAFGRAKDKAKVKAHIKARAKALGAEDMLPDDWKTKGDDEADPIGSIANEDLAKDGSGDDGAEPTEAEKVAAKTDELLKSLAESLNALDAPAKEEKEEPTEKVVPSVLLTGIELRKGMWDVAGFASILMEVAYLVFSAESEAQMEGDASPVPEKLRGAFAALADAYRAMSEEELAELQARVNGEATSKVVNIALAELLKDSDEIAKTAALTGIVKPFITNAAIVDADDEDRLTKAVAAAEEAKALAAKLTGENDTLLKKLGDTNTALAELNDRVIKLSSEPIPSKTAGSIHAVHAVEKVEDTSGIRVSKAISTDEIMKVIGELQRMPEEDRAFLLTKAALGKPYKVNHSPVRVS